MTKYKHIASTFILLLTFFAVSAKASVTFDTFTDEKFSTLQSQGANILVDISAPWCKTCKKQKKILQTYTTERPDTDLVILSVDFDTQKEAVKRFGAKRQSTLVLFKNKERVWYSVAETDSEKIYKALDKVTHSSKK